MKPTFIALLALCLCVTLGCKQPLPKDIPSLTALAEKGDAEAQLRLGWIYAEGEGVEKDGKEAVEWYHLAAEQGLALAQYNLGWIYAEGEGVEKDGKEAVKWYREAAEQGDADAQYNLGWIYAEGEGVEKDGKEAVKWYRKAAEQGDADAQHNLGKEYRKVKDFKQAAKWFRKAAEQGHAKAQYNLGVMYDDGEGMPEDEVTAYAWYNIADANKYAEAKKTRENLGELMTPEQLSKGKSLIKHMFNENPKLIRKKQLPIGMREPRKPNRS